MEDTTLINISISVAMIGIFILLLFSFYDKIPEKGFNEITSKDASSQVKINGTIKQVYHHNSSLTLKLKQECLMDVMIFDKNEDFSIGENVIVQGEVQEYNGKQEIIADKIVKIK
jgi:RecG-like helicase